MICHLHACSVLSVNIFPSFLSLSLCLSLFHFIPIWNLAAKAALHRFLQSKEATQREKDLLKSTKVTQWNRLLPYTTSSLGHGFSYLFTTYTYHATLCLQKAAMHQFCESSANSCQSSSQLAKVYIPAHIPMTQLYHDMPQPYTTLLNKIVGVKGFRISFPAHQYNLIIMHTCVSLCSPCRILICPATSLEK